MCIRDRYKGKIILGSFESILASIERVPYCLLARSVSVGLRQDDHQRWVWDAVFSADSYYIITASSDQSAKLWDVSTIDSVTTVLYNAIL